MIGCGNYSIEDIKLLFDSRLIIGARYEFVHRKDNILEFLGIVNEVIKYDADLNPILIKGKYYKFKHTNNLNREGVVIYVTEILGKRRWRRIT